MRAIRAALTLTMMLVPQYAFAWGDEGHKIVALIAEHYLNDDVRRTVASMLAADPDPLTQHDIASEATWADKYRNHHRETGKWHFADIEIDHPDITEACFGREPLSAETLASNGPGQSCVIDKIKQFAEELSAPGVDPEEKLVALKFLLHFVGDMHQPLHSSDNHDRGGNQVKIIVDGFPHKSRDELHAFWDTQFVKELGTSPNLVASELIDKITPADVKAWSNGSLDDWAMETFKLAKADVYGDPPLSKNELQHLDTAYADQAVKDVALQLSRAGVRLALVLNKSLSAQRISTNE
jgi:S1/P1 Nuclease